ncbi:MAG: lysylphosphatidylglycerol synthase transmembrane domain-containing protein [Candidatus Pacebacteria bacterium]|nr:lysylphosphatidylglycerol synthase transmembrane domain-containing protein [Candidatus Paceibacterota bacterium]
MSRSLKSVLVVLLGALIFAVVTAKAGPQNLGRAFSLLFDFWGLALLFLTLLAVFFGVLRLRIIFKSFGDDLPLKDIFYLWLSGFSVSYLAPFSIFSGDAVKAYFTKKRFNHLSWERNISTSAIDRIADATLFFIFMLAGLAVFAFNGELSFCLSAGVLGVAGVMLALLLLFYFKRWRRESAIIWLFKITGIDKFKFFRSQETETVLRAEKEVFQFFSCSKKYFWQAMAFSLARQAALFCRAGLLIFLLAGKAGFFRTLAVFGFANLGSMSPVPASLGTLDLSLGLAFSGLGLGFSTGAVFTMVWRASDLLFAFAGLGFFIKFGLNAAESKILDFFKRKP